jgi:hypothetical protein
LVLLPTIKKIAQELVTLMQPVTIFISKNKQITSVIAHTVAGFMSLRIATFALGYASTFLFGGWNRLVIGAKGLRLALGLLGAGLKTLLFGGFGAAALVIGGLSVATSGFRKEAVGGLATELGLVGTELEEVTAAASQGLSPAFEVLKKHAGTVSETLRKRFTPELEALEETFKPVSENLTATFESISAKSEEAFKPISKKLMPILEDISTKFEKGLLPHFDSFKGRLKAVAVGVSSALVPTCEKFHDVLGKIIGDIKSGAIPVIESLRRVFSGFSTMEVGQIIAGLALLGSSFLLITKAILPLAFVAFKGLGKVLWSLAKNIIPLVFSGINLVGRSFWFLVSSVFPLVYSGFKELASQAWRAASYNVPAEPGACRK